MHFNQIFKFKTEKLTRQSRQASANQILPTEKTVKYSQGPE